MMSEKAILCTACLNSWKDGKYVRNYYCVAKYLGYYPMNCRSMRYIEWKRRRMPKER